MPLFSPRLPRAFPCLPLQKGFGLFEVLLGISAISVMSLAVYSLFFASNVSADVKNAQKNLGTLSSQLERSFGTTGGYRGLTLNQAISDGLLPKAYTRGGAVETEWGAGLDVHALSIQRPDDGFVIRYASVPTEACTQLAIAMAPNLYDLRISGSTVFSSTGMDPAAVGSQCNRSEGATMEFVYYSGLSTGSAVAVASAGTPGNSPSSPASSVAAGVSSSSPLGAPGAAGVQALAGRTADVASQRTSSSIPSVASPKENTAPDSASGLPPSFGRTWERVGQECVTSDDPQSPYNTCPGAEEWEAWQNIPNTTGQPLCSQLLQAAVPGSNCVAELRLDTRSIPCVRGSQAVVQEFGAVQGINKITTRYSLKKYLCK